MPICLNCSAHFKDTTHGDYCSFRCQLNAGKHEQDIADLRTQLDAANERAEERYRIMEERWRSACGRVKVAERERDRLAMDALCALSHAKIGTPEHGYVAEPACLRGDIGRLAMERDAERETHAATKAALEIARDAFKELRACYHDHFELSPYTRLDYLRGAIVGALELWEKVEAKSDGC